MYIIRQQPSHLEPPLCPKSSYEARIGQPEYLSHKNESAENGHYAFLKFDSVQKVMGKKRLAEQWSRVHFQLTLHSQILVGRPCTLNPKLSTLNTPPSTINHKP